MSLDISYKSIVISVTECPRRACNFLWLKRISEVSSHNNASKSTNSIAHSLSSDAFPRRQLHKSQYDNGRIDSKFSVLYNLSAPQTPCKCLVTCFPCLMHVLFWISLEPSLVIVAQVFVGVNPFITP